MACFWGGVDNQVRGGLGPFQTDLPDFSPLTLIYDHRLIGTANATLSFLPTLANKTVVKNCLFKRAMDTISANNLTSMHTNRQGETTMLSAAVKMGSPKIVAALMEENIDPNSTDGFQKA